MKRVILIVGIIVIVLAGVGFGLWKMGKLERIIPSRVEKELQEKGVTFVHAAKQFAFNLPEKWSVTESINGRQTYIYPSGKKVTAKTLQALVDADVIVVETALNNKDSFETLINDVKSQAEKNGATVTVDTKNIGNLRTSTLTVKGKTTYKQTLFDTPSVIILTAKTDHPIFDEVAKTVTIDLSPFATQIAEASDLKVETVKDIADGNFDKLYDASSEGLKEAKKKEDFSSLLKDVSSEFKNNVLIRGIYFNAAGAGIAINVVEGNKVIRNGSFFYKKEKDTFRFDGLFLSGKISPKAQSEPTPTPKTGSSPKAP